MTGLFDARDSAALARRNAAPGLPATLGESAASAFADVAANDMSISAGLALRDEYERYLETVEAATGRRFDNPVDAPAGVRDFTLDEPNPALQRLAEDFPALGVSLQRRARPKTREERERELFTELSKLKAGDFPDLDVRTPAQIEAAVVGTRRAARERRAEVAARETTLGAQIAGFAGAAGALLLDPPVFASMAFGAPGATSVLRGALIDAGIGAAVEVPVQAAVQAARARLGEDTSLSEAALNVLSVGAGGFLFSGLLRGGARGAGKLVETVRDRNLARTRAERDALTFLERQNELEQANPFDSTPRSRAEHEARLSDAQLGLRENRPTVLRGEPPAPVRREVLRGDPPLEKTVAFEDGPLAQSERSFKDLGANLRRTSADDIAETEAAKRLAATIRPFLGEDEDLAGFVAMLRRPPEPRGERLSTFLKREGGVREDRGELRALGLPKAQPGLMRAEGLPLDEAGLRAADAGFFPERPTLGELLDALGEDLNVRPVRRAEDEAAAAADESLRADIEDTLRDLDELGIDLNRLSDTEAAGRLREAVERLAPAAGRSPGTSRAVSAAGAERAALDVAEAEADMFSGALDAGVRAEFADDLDRIVVLEDEAGNIFEVRAGDVLDDLDGDETLLREYRACLATGALP